MMKLSKKLISILLSVLMVVSMIPFSGITALADAEAFSLGKFNYAESRFDKASGSGETTYKSLLIAYGAEPIDGEALILPTMDGFVKSTSASTNHSTVINMEEGKTPAEIAEYVKSITFTKTADHENQTILVTISEIVTPYKTFYYEDVEHYYQYVPFNSGVLNWVQAYEAARNTYYAGRQGYLATITSEEENDFIYEASESVGWLGGTILQHGDQNGNYYDDFSTTWTSTRNVYNGTTTTNKNDFAAKWYWAAGPEIGETFYDRRFYNETGDGVVDINYSNWNIGNTTNLIEPNDPELEHCLATVKASGNFTWNNIIWNRNDGDSKWMPIGYFVEYGDKKIGDSGSVTDVLSDKVLITECEHPSYTHTEYRAPTCTENGVIEFYTCNECGRNFTDAEMRNRLNETTVIPATGHNWDAGVITTAPTCEETGVMTYTCQNDSSHTKTEEVAATGHNYVAVVTTQPTCTEQGVRTYTCQNDNSHQYNEIIPATGHDWDEGVITKLATEEDPNGIITYTCKNDSSHTYTEEYIFSEGPELVLSSLNGFPVFYVGEEAATAETWLQHITDTVTTEDGIKVEAKNLDSVVITDANGNTVSTFEEETSYKATFVYSLEGYKNNASLPTDDAADTASYISKKLTVVHTFTPITAPASGVSYNLWFYTAAAANTNVQATSDNCRDVLGDKTARYDPTTRTLFLNNYGVDKDQYNIYYTDSQQLNVVFAGVNIKGSNGSTPHGYYGLYASQSPLHIKGGSFTVNNAYNGGIFSAGALTVNCGGDIDSTSKLTGFGSNNAITVSCIKFEGETTNPTSSNTTNYGVIQTSNGAVSVNAASIDINAKPAAATGTNGIYSGSTMTVNVKGDINIETGGGHGIFNAGGTTAINTANLNVTSARNYGVYSQNALTIDVPGDITVNSKYSGLGEYTGKMTVSCDTLVINTTNNVSSVATNYGGVHNSNGAVEITTNSIDINACPSATTGTNGVYSGSTMTLNVTGDISVETGAGHGIFNAGSTTTINTTNLNVTSNGNYGVYSQNALTIDVPGDITVNSKYSGLGEYTGKMTVSCDTLVINTTNNVSSVATNYGGVHNSNGAVEITTNSIDINACPSATTGTNGVYSGSTMTLNVTGDISVETGAGHGIFNAGGATTINTANLNVTSNGNYGVYSQNALTIDIPGDITVNSKYSGLGEYTGKMTLKCDDLNATTNYASSSSNTNYGAIHNSNGAVDIAAKTATLNAQIDGNINQGTNGIYAGGALTVDVDEALICKGGAGHGAFSNGVMTINAASVDIESTKSYGAYAGNKADIITTGNQVIKGYNYAVYTGNYAVKIKGEELDISASSTSTSSTSVIYTTNTFTIDCNIALIEALGAAQVAVIANRVDALAGDITCIGKSKGMYTNTVNNLYTPLGSTVKIGQSAADAADTDYVSISGGQERYVGQYTGYPYVRITTPGSGAQTPEPATVVTAPVGLTKDYNGNAQVLITAGTAENGTMVYSLDGENYSETLPTRTNVNTYTVYYKVIGDTGYTDTEPATVTARINPIAPVVLPPEGLTKDYSGEAQTIVKAGVVFGGTMYYFTITDENAEPTVNDEGWTTTAPTRTNIAKYYTWYYVKGDANHTDTTPVRVTSEIIDDPDDGYNLTLDDGIEVNFLIDTPFYDTEDGFITYEYITDIDTENAAREGGRIDVEELTTYTSGDVYNGDRKLTLKAAPAQIAEDFVVKVYAKDADPTKDEPVSQYTVSIEDYCTTIINNADKYEEKTVNLAKSILNYGQLANEYFGYATKHAEVNPTDEPYVVTTVGDYQADLTEAELNDIRSKASASIVNQGSVAIRGVTYITQMDPEFRFYLGTDVTEAQAAAMTLTVSEGLQARMINTKWGICVSVTGLKSNEFGRVFSLTVGDTTINYNGYAYLASVFKDGTNNSSQLLKNLAKGIYRYSVACNEAFA